VLQRRLQEDYIVLAYSHHDDYTCCVKPKLDHPKKAARSTVEKEKTTYGKSERLQASG